MSNPDNPIYVLPDQDLIWSPHAPDLTFRAQEGGWGMGGQFKLQHLRLPVKDKGKERYTFVNRDERGRVYYLPRWPLFTALADAKTDPEIITAARGLADLDPGQTAPELGFRMPIAIHLVLRTAPAAGDIRETKKWNSERAFLSYWSKMDKNQKARAATVRVAEWGLLDLAIQHRQFLVAEELWNSGLRFSPALAKEGTPAWALTEGLLDYIPSYNTVLEGWKGKRTHAFLLNIIHEEKVSELGQRIGDLLDTPGKQDAFLALTQRWLRRMKDDQVNFNATAQVTTTENGQADLIGFRTPFMHVMSCPATSGWKQQITEIRVWARAMLDGTYDIKKEVVEPLLMESPEPVSIATFAGKVCPDEEVNSWISNAFLESHLESAPSSTPKSRF